MIRVAHQGISIAELRNCPFEGAPSVYAISPWVSSGVMIHASLLTRRDGADAA